ncbi:kinase-like protein [Suillus weaverae]|nr:kinase-like protein [Suillus weaverae]
MLSRSRQTTAAAKQLTLTPVLTLKGHQHTTTSSISYFPDGKRMISGSGDKTTRQWDLEGGKEIEEARDVCEQEVHAVGVSSDGRWVVSAGGDSHCNTGELKVREVETGIVRIFEGHSEKINCIDISGDSTLLASGADDNTTRIWNLETGKLVAGPFKNDNDRVGTVRFSQDSKMLALKSWCGDYLEVWDVATQSLIGHKDGDESLTIGINHTFAPVSWTTKDKTIVTAFSATYLGSWRSLNTISEFDASTLQTIGVPFQGHTNIIISLALSLDCTLLASASHDETIKLWAFESRQLLSSFDAPYIARHLIFSPDSRQLVYTAMRSNNIYLCNTPPEILASIQPVTTINTPRNLPLADSDAISLVNQSTSEALPNVQQSLIPYSLLPPPVSFARRRAGSESWTDRHSGTSRIQPTKMQPLTDTWKWPAPLQIYSSTVGSRLPHLLPDPRELLPSSSHTHTVFSARKVELDDLPPEATLKDLSKHITKDGDYPIARGGFGEIWKCTYHIDRTSIKVAVKALQVYADDQLGAAKTKKIKRIKRELRICANLKHANILPIYGYSYGFGPFLAIVSPWAENGNLTVYLEREGAALTLVQRFQILKDIIAGLQYLHANSVIHGDFTGPNVLIHGDGTACVADFGLSLMYSEVITASQASWTSTLKGNMRWVAPELLVEQEDGSQARPSKQSDMYSFGSIMLQVLTNKIPYYHLSNDAAIILCIAKSQTPSRSRYPELPERYWQFIEQCWSTDPRERPSTEGADTAIRNEFYSLSRSR